MDKIRSVVTKITIAVDERFDLKTAVCGHGWYDLSPFSWNAEKETLGFVVHDAETGEAAHAEVSGDPGGLVVRLRGGKVRKPKVVRDVRHVLRLDEELEEFYGTAEGVPGIEWVNEKRGGRLLRSSTVFEDMVKTMCTTNCSWSLTRKMAENIVAKLGHPTGVHGLNAFPTADAMAEVDEDFYRSEIRAGYRSPYFVELARAVAEGKFDPESLLDRDVPTDELRSRIKSVKGFGDYATDNLLKLLGRYDGLALDSWVRARYAEKHGRGKACSDKKIARHYAKFGKWKGLAIWCDMTESWHTEGRGS